MPVDGAGSPDPVLATLCPSDGTEPTVVEMTYESLDDDFEQRLIVILPCNFRPNKFYDAIVLVHGSGSWESQSDRWIPYGIELATMGYVAVYPESRNGRYRVGATDLLSAILWVESHVDVRIDDVGVVAGSFGNMAGLDLVERYPDAVQAYVDLYGVLDPGEPYFHLNEERIASIQAPVLMQAGSRDPHKCAMIRALDLAIEEYNPSIPNCRLVYPGSTHGFFFRNSDPQSLRARAHQIAFFDTVLRGAPRPGGVCY